MPQQFFAPPRFIDSGIRVLLIGAGGTGSEVLDALARTHLALLKLGHPGGLAVTVMDGDLVSPANIGRQRFAPCDIGHAKSHVLVHRYNVFYGLDWSARAQPWTPDEALTVEKGPADLIISCVDRAAVRIEIARAASLESRDTLWLDFGNGAETAQCVLGHLEREPRNSPLRLPHVFDLFPELKSVDDRSEPSCSLAEALAQQDLFINRTIANAGMSVLWQLLRKGSITHHGAFVNLKEGTQHPLLIDPPTWACFGYDSAVTPPLCRKGRSRRSRRRTA
jgi:PRTRC genetic system ThiF family protein